MDYDKEEHIQSKIESPNPTEIQYSEHPFDRLMFGPSQSKKHVDHEKKSTETSGEDNLLDQVNLEEIMMHIDSLVGSAKQLKPMFSKIKPLFDQFLKK